MQTRTCSFSASGSSVARASAQGKTVASSRPVCYGPQGGWLILLRSDMSGMSVLSGLRASVETFPMSWAFPTAESYARYDSPAAYGRLSLSQYSSASLRIQEPLGPPKCFDVSLPACHGLRTPADLHILAKNGCSCGAFGVRYNPRRPQQAPFRSGPSPSGCALTPAAYRLRCRRFTHLVHRVSTAPPWTHDALRVGGSPLPDKDFHLVRDAKLCLAR